MRVLSLIGIIASLLLSGCASYQLGEPTQLPYRVLSVASPKNLSSLPNLEGALASALRQSILQAAPLELSQSTNHDAILELTILEAKRDIAAVTAEDVGRGRKFEFKIDFELSLRKTGAAEEYFIRSRIFTIKRDIFTESGLVDAEHQAGPEIAREAAVKTIEIITDLW